VSSDFQAEVLPKRVGEKRRSSTVRGPWGGEQVMQYDEECRGCWDDRLEPVRLATCPRQEPQFHEIGLETLTSFGRRLLTQVIAREALKVVRWDEHSLCERVQSLSDTRAHDRF